MQKYVAGFMFNSSGEVALVRKNKPEWQKGRLNGIGGKIEEGETPLAAMIREFEEETGYLQPSWDQFCTLTGDGFEVHFFSVLGDTSLLRTMEEEEIVVVEVEEVQIGTCIPNLTWLIPMAMTTGYDRGLPFNIQEYRTEDK